jgi:hypothetical protein
MEMRKEERVLSNKKKKGKKGKVLKNWKGKRGKYEYNNVQGSATVAPPTVQLG